jgi:putative endopeptidase
LSEPDGHAGHLPPAVKDKTESIARTVVSVLRNRLQRLEWMGPDTKREALSELDSYIIKIGYPEHSRDYASLVITDDDLVGNVRRSGAFDWSFQLRRLSGAVDRTEWLLTPQTVQMANGSRPSRSDLATGSTLRPKVAFESGSGSP